MSANNRCFHHEKSLRNVGGLFVTAKFLAPILQLHCTPQCTTTVDPNWQCSIIVLPRLLQVCLLVALISMSFSCVQPCKGDYGTRPGLSRHQINCPIFRTSQALKIEHRRAMQIRKPHQLSDSSGGLKVSNKFRSTKLATRKSRIEHQGSNGLLVSLSVNQNGWCDGRMNTDDCLPASR